jgi:hypothetical protein
MEVFTIWVEIFGIGKTQSFQTFMHFVDKTIEQMKEKRNLVEEDSIWSEMQTCKWKQFRALNFVAQLLNFVIFLLLQNW